MREKQGKEQFEHILGSTVKRVAPMQYERLKILYRKTERRINGIIKKEVCISNLVVCVGQACNFRCKNCGNFAPIAPAECRRYEVENIIDNIKCVLKNIDCLESIGIQGGEPFLYTDLSQLLEYLGEEKNHTGKIKKIGIATNGSIFPSQEVIALLKKYDITVRISDYKLFPQKTEKMYSMCKQEKIPYAIYEFASQEGAWYDLGGVNDTWTTTQKEAALRFEKCDFRGCLTLEHGELWHCSRATNSYAVQGFEKKEKDYVRVRDDSNFRKELKKYLLRLSPMEACYYCNGTAGTKMIPPAIQM